MSSYYIVRITLHNILNLVILIAHTAQVFVNSICRSNVDLNSGSSWERGGVGDWAGRHIARGLDPAKENFKFCVNVNPLSF